MNHLYDKRILIVGDVVGAYRSQILIKTLLDSGCTLSFVGKNFYGSRRIVARRNIALRALRRIRTLIGRVLMCMELLIKAPFADLIYVLAMNQRYMLDVTAVKHLFRKKVVADLYISLYDTTRDWNEENRFQSWWAKILDRLMLEQSDLLIHLSEHELRYIADLVGTRYPEKVEILPLAVDVKPKRNWSQSYNIDPQIFRVCWWGSYIPLHGLPSIVSAFKLLRHDGLPVRLSLYGVPDGSGDMYKEMIEESGLTDIVKIDNEKSFNSGELAPLLIRECDLALGIFGDSDKARNCLPNKVVDALGMALPVLTMDSLGVREVIDVDNDLFVCSSSPIDIANSIRQLMDNRGELARRAQQGHKKFAEAFTPEKYTDGLNKALSKL